VSIGHKINREHIINGKLEDIGSGYLTGLNSFHMNQRHVV
jgi:hypothetical protein